MSIFQYFASNVQISYADGPKLMEQCHPFSSKLRRIICLSLYLILPFGTGCVNEI